ncbi:hypothetical protein BKA62DRAFT_618367 [Auriculariales sp. MPI-PUGE-AT-0066]|nr:hypothetical protein BKA62DRAFT_618367 [Auriculariales sp. MPI-PUGE-AT-0066]
MLGTRSTFLQLLLTATSVSAINILFVGNSFTHGNIEPTVSYNKGNINDANGSGYGGVPGIFKKLADTAGKNYSVTIEAVSAQTLEFHYENRASIIAQKQWNVVVLQEYSTLPVPAARGGNPTLFAQGVANVVALVRAHSNATVYLYETWVRPDQVYPSGAPYSGQDIRVMQTDLHNSYTTQSSAVSAKGVAYVGDGFVKAIDSGLADANPYDSTVATVDVWASDNYHASKYGSYLSAVTIFSKVTGVSPTSLANGAGTAAEGLGITAGIATKLQASVVV